MSLSLLPAQVRQAVTARIAALNPMYDASDINNPLRSYSHTASGAWRESERPLLPEWEPDPVAHLAFFVDDRTAEDGGRLDLASPRMTDESVRSLLTVRFLFELRPRQEIVDWDAAATAAAHMRGWLFNTGWEPPGLTIDSDPIAGRRQPTGKQEWLLVESTFLAIYDLNLYPE